MAASGFDRALALVLKHEGGYVDHPADPGGATNLGITRATLAAWRGGPVGKADVKALGRDEAKAIYRARYWDAVSGDLLPPGVDLAVFDAAVNSGPDRAVRWLQTALAVPADGVIGPVTRAALAACDPAAVVTAFSARRLAFLKGLATWPTFGRGWTRRVRETEAAALAAVAASPSVPTAKETSAMPDHKPVLESKTVWANLIGLAALLLPLVGVPAGAVDAGGLAEAAAQAVAALSFIASSVFRIAASRRLVP